MPGYAQVEWLGWQDSNLRMPGSKPGALPLGDTPILFSAYHIKWQEPPSNRSFQCKIRRGPNFASALLSRSAGSVSNAKPPVYQAEIPGWLLPAGSHRLQCNRDLLLTPRGDNFCRRYLLRKFAKAAKRDLPTRLLKPHQAALFVCLRCLYR